MQRLLALSVLAAAAPIALSDNGDFTSQETPAYRGQVGAEFVAFDVFTEAFGAPNAPDLAQCGAAFLTGLEPAALITSTGNIYSFSTETKFQLDYDQSAPLFDVRLQLRTLGAPLDDANVRLVPIDKNGVAGTPLSPDSVTPLAGGPGEFSFSWDLSLAGLTNGSFQVLFEASGPSMSLDVALLDVFCGRGSLEADVADVSAGTGGTQNLAIDAGSDNAGQTYLVLGSRSGTGPGVTLDGVSVPLNFDGYTLNTVSGANGGVFQNTLGVLNACGQAGAAIVVPAGLDPALVGLTLDHAAVVIDTTLLQIVFATDSTSIAIQF